MIPSLENIPSFLGNGLAKIASGKAALAVPNADYAPAALVGSPPQAISGLNRYYAADQLQKADGAVITSWPEITGSGGTLTKTGTGNTTYLEAGIAGKPAVLVENVYFAETSGAAIAAGSYTLFVVLEPLNQNGGEVFLGLSSDGNRWFGHSGQAARLIGQAASLTTSNPTTIADPLPWILVVTSDGTTLTIYQNGVATSVASAETASWTGGITLGATGTGSFTGYNLYAEFGTFNRALTSAEAGSLSLYLQRKYAKPILRSDGPTFVFDGNSIPAGVGASKTQMGLVRQFVELAGFPKDCFVNTSYGGATSTQLNARFATAVAPFVPKGKKDVYLWPWEGTNSLVPSDTTAYLATAVASGATVFAETPLSRSGELGSGGMEDTAAALRSTGSGGWQTAGAVGLIDHKLDPCLGIPGQYLDSFWFFDQVHPQDPGHLRIARARYNHWLAYARPFTPGIQFWSSSSATTVSASIATGSQVVTPASMAGIAIGTQLIVANSNGTNSETVTVTARTNTTFTATFATSKTGPGITVVPKQVVKRMLLNLRSPTSGDNQIYWLRLYGSLMRWDTIGEYLTFEQRYRISIQSGVVTVTAVGTPLADYVTLSTANISVAPAGTGEGFDIFVTGEPGKIVAAVVSMDLAGVGK